MDTIKVHISNEGCNNVHNLENENDFNEFDILRSAYELILENSQFFWDELAIAFRIESEKSKDLEVSGF